MEIYRGDKKKNLTHITLNPTQTQVAWVIRIVVYFLPVFFPPWCLFGLLYFQNLALCQTQRLSINIFNQLVYLPKHALYLTLSASSWEYFFLVVTFFQNIFSVFPPDFIMSRQQCSIIEHLDCFRPSTITINQSWDKYPQSSCCVHTYLFPSDKFLAVGFLGRHSWKVSNTYITLSSTKVVPIYLATSNIDIFLLNGPAFDFDFVTSTYIFFSSIAFMLRKSSGKSPFKMRKGPFVCSSCFCNAMHSWKLYHKMVSILGNRLSSCIPIAVLIYHKVISFIIRNK